MKRYPHILIITGVMASGKSSVAQAVAQRISRSVHLRGDVFRRMVVGGRAEMSLPPSNEALAQIKLRYALAIQTAQTYLEAGYTVVYQDVLMGDDIRHMVSQLRGWPCHIIVLCPRQKVVARREAGRKKKAYGAVSIAELDETLRETSRGIGFWLDNSDLGVEQTADAILAHTGISKT